MTSTKDLKIVEDVVKETMQEMKKHYPGDYAKLERNATKFQAIKDAAKKTAHEEINLAKEFSGGEFRDIREKLAKHLPEARIKLIEKSLEIPTFRMHIQKQADGKHMVEIKSEKGDLYTPRLLLTTADVDWSNIKQYASIVVEGVLLVLSAIGLSLSPGEHAIEEAVDETADTIENSSQFQRAIKAFIDSWKSAGSSATQKAKSLFYLIKDTYSAGILWNIIKTVCQNMAWYDWLETAAKVTAMIVAALATEGAALIAKIALIIMSATDFARKIANVVQLNEISESMN